MEAGKLYGKSVELFCHLLKSYRNRDVPSGYKLSMIPFENGEPAAASDSTTAAVDIFANVDNRRCPDDCFRPAGLAFDNQGRLFMSSDATGEIYVIIRESAIGTNSTDGNQTPQICGGRKFDTPALTMIALVALTGFLVLA